MFARLRKMISEQIDSGESFDEAMSQVADEIRKNMPLTEEVIEEAVQIASMSVGRMVIRDSRAAVCKRAESVKQHAMGRTEELKEKVAGLLEFRLPGGKPIREATGTECIEASTFYYKIAETNRVRGRFLLMVGQKAGKMLVGQALDEQVCHRLYKEACNERDQNRARAA